MTSAGFELGEGFVAGSTSGGIDLGPLGEQYQQLFAEALADGVITEEERERLERAAANLGIDRQKLNQLEQAMITAHEAHHRVKVVEKWEQEPRSLSPIQVAAAGDPEKTMLLKQIERLNERVAALETELREARANVNVEVDLTHLDQSEGSESDALDAIRSRIGRDPTNPEWYRALFRRASDTETRVWASQALVVLGVAAPDHQALYQRHKQTALIAPRTSLGLREWNDHLVHPEQDALTGHILGRIAPAVLVGHVAELQRAKKLVSPRPEQKQTPGESTVMAVRALGWAAAVLGMSCPATYVDADRQGAYVHVPGVPPYTVVGGGVLRGKTHLQQAFLAGRHLSAYRQEHFVKTLFSSVTDLEDLFLAALLLGSPSLPIAEHLRRRVAPISKALGPLLDGKQLDALRKDFKHFVAEGGRTNLQRWSTSVDKTACRAGLLLSADLPSAVEQLVGEEGPQGPLATDLLGFAVSEAHAKLRKHLGVCWTDA